MKKLILSFLVMSISGCFNTGDEKIYESVSIKEFDLEKNLIRINGKSIAGEKKVIDTGLLIDNTSDNILWVQEELLIASKENKELKSNISGGSLKSFNIKTKIIKEIIPYNVDSVCMEDGIIKINEISIGKDKDENKILANYLQENNTLLNNLRVESYKKNEYNIAEMDGGKLLVTTATNGCEETYLFNKNEKIKDEDTELVSYIEGVYPFVSVKVYHDNSPKQKSLGNNIFKEKDFPRTRIHYKYTDYNGVVQEKFYKMNLDIDYLIKVTDFENFNKIEGEIKGDLITAAFHVVDQIYIVNFTKLKDGIKPESIEKIDISTEIDRLFLKARFKKINKVKNGYILTLENENGIELIVEYKNELGFSYLIKGFNISNDIKVSEDLCNVAIGHKFKESELKTVKILNVCN